MANLLKFPTLKPKNTISLLSTKTDKQANQVNTQKLLMENQQVIIREQEEKIQKFLDKLYGSKYK